MPGVQPGPDQILAVLLGAGWYAQSPKLAQGPSFENSARDMREYLTRPDGMGLPRTNINWLFDDTRSAADQLRDVEDWLERREQQLKAAGTPATDLIVYYCGHGMFCGPKRAYHLAIRATKESSESLTSISVSELARALNEHARFLRKFLVLDCCFAGAAYLEFQSGPLDASRTQLVNELPGRGTALLCAASAKEAAIAPQALPRTMFSDSLLKALENGHPSMGAHMSLSELGGLIKENLKESFPQNWVRPEIHCPDQREGAVADVSLFPNPAAAWQEAVLNAEFKRAEEERRSKETEEQLARKEAEVERKVRELEETCRKAEEDRRAEEARLAKAREELERIHKAAQDPEAAAIRKAEEDRKAELARLQLAAREQEQRRRAEDQTELERQEEQAKRVDEAARKAQEQKAGESKRSLRIGETFRDGPNFPEMVVIGRGQFQMGSPNSDKHAFPDEKPRHLVKIDYPFAVGKFPVTVGEWRRFADATSRPGDGWREPGFPQDDRHPVVCVSWQDAVDYAWWLRQKTGQNYRLLSEAEFEYALRAGSDKRYPWGDDTARMYDDTARMYRYTKARSELKELGGTWPVGQYRANPFGLHDMSGNVWQWVQDCYHANYKLAPADGSAWTTACEAGHVVRGGSWYNDLNGLRSAARARDVDLRGQVDDGKNFIGVRVAAVL